MSFRLANVDGRAALVRDDAWFDLERLGTGAPADPMEALKTAAAEWDATTENLGVDQQKAYYEDFLKLPGATVENTVEALGMAVKL